jgi:hypothetical protein
MLQWLRSLFARKQPQPAVATIAPAPTVQEVQEDALSAMLAIAIDDVPELPEVVAVEAAIRTEIESGQLAIPPMPSGAARMLELVGRSDLDLNALVAAMHWEPAVVARVLAVANSAVYRGAAPVRDDLRGAMIALGLRMVGEIAAGIASRSLFQVESRSEYDLFPELWQAAHRETMVVAFGASALAHNHHLPRPDRVFLRAVLAGAARTMALRALASQLVDGRLSERPSVEAIGAAVDGMHREVAAMAAARGILPALNDNASAAETAAVDLVASLVELRRAPGRVATTRRAREQIHTLRIQPGQLRVILRECDEAEHRVTAMLAA